MMLRRFSAFPSSLIRTSRIITSQQSLNTKLFTTSSLVTKWKFNFLRSDDGESYFSKLAKKVGYTVTDTPKSKLGASGYLLYIKIADEVNFANFYKLCNLEDSFVSWFLVLELHVWMLCVRLMEEGDEGLIMRNSLIKAMWEDSEMRSKKLEGAIASYRKEQVAELNLQFQATMIAYDEGLIGNDKVLAGALWRRFLSHSVPANDEELTRQMKSLELLVIYVRSQYFALHKLSKEDVAFKRKLTWDPFDESLYKLTDRINVRKMRV